MTKYNKSSCVNDNIGDPETAMISRDHDGVHQHNTAQNDLRHVSNAGSPGRIMKRLRHFLTTHWQTMELVILVVVFFIIWGLVSLPTVFYHLPQAQVT